MLKDMLDARKCLVERPQRRPKHRWEGSIKIHLRKMLVKTQGLQIVFFFFQNKR
jgi:hypothetical protein